MTGPVVTVHLTAATMAAVRRAAAEGNVSAPAVVRRAVAAWALARGARLLVRRGYRDWRAPLALLAWDEGCQPTAGAAARLALAAALGTSEGRPRRADLSALADAVRACTGGPLDAVAKRAARWLVARGAGTAGLPRIADGERQADTEAP